MAALLILGGGSYFGYKYVFKKYFTRAATTTSPSPKTSIFGQTPSSPQSPSVTPTVTSSVQPTSVSKAMPNTDYVIADSSSRVISESELTNLSYWQLKVARNEIYARHGRPFVHKDLQCYFSSKSWYKINPNFDNSLLTVTENKNIDAIHNHELKINSPIIDQDTGC